MLQNLKTNFVLLFICLTFVFEAVCQEQKNHSENVADCYGAISIPENVIITPNFTGSSGKENVLMKWKDSLRLETFNSVWLQYTAGQNGEFKLKGETGFDPLELVIFRVSEDESCSTIEEGTTRIHRHQFFEKKQTLFEIKEIELHVGQKLFIYLNTSSATKQSITLQPVFQFSKEKQNISNMRVEEDLRTDITEPHFHLKIRDAKTGLPIVSRIIISESKNYNALYKASDIYFDHTGFIRFHIKVDAEGYFFQDIEVNIRDEEQKELIINLNPLEKNQEIELEGIQFLRQSDTFTEEAKPKLRRLRDFLALNESVKIEIHGHVHKVGKNNWEAKRLSRKRAEKVKDYLVNNGIDKSRISTMGFGNSKMIYPNPENDEQKSANRRVEIKIK